MPQGGAVRPPAAGSRGPPGPQRRPTRMSRRGPRASARRGRGRAERLRPEAPHGHPGRPLARGDRIQGGPRGKQDPGGAGKLPKAQGWRHFIYIRSVGAPPQGQLLPAGPGSARAPAGLRPPGTPAVGLRAPWRTAGHTTHTTRVAKVDLLQQLKANRMAPWGHPCNTTFSRPVRPAGW